MKTKKYFIMFALALLVCSCQDDEQGSVQPTPGQDVKFGVSLEQNSSRTIYGPENNKGFPIYWVEGDEVIVSSPNCANDGGVGSAIYKVHVDIETQNYASSLEKTKETGVRWGSNETGDFYSVYPVSSSHTKLGSDYKTVTLTMPAQQDNNIVTEDDARIIRSDMRSCFMYAAETGVQSGETVNLKYKPLSTALRFTLRGPQTGDPVTINYVRIYAPAGTYISGTYNVDLSTATDEKLPTMKIVDGLGRNYVTMNAADASTGAYLTLAQYEEIEMNAFLLIADNTVMTDEWYIEIGTSSGKSYKKYLDTSAPDDKRTLVPGKVHRLSEALPPLASDAWNASNWMANLQRNVYLSEISIPGSWYSLDQDYQSDIRTVEGQYNIGVRAFHFDTRWIAERSGNFITGYTYTPTDLGIAGTADNYDPNEGRYLQSTDNPMTFETALGQVVEKVKSDEYMVVMCTFAQGSAQYGDWRKEISDACDKYPGKIVEASSINKNTVVGDVLGKVIVIVNTYTEGEVANSKCMFFNMSLLLDKDFPTYDYYEKPLYWYNITPSGITMYGTHAQATNDFDQSGSYDSDRQSYVPTIDERKTQLQNILTWSQNNYAMGNSEHNNWIYMGLGGYAIPSSIIDSDNYEAVSTGANGLNTWLGAKVEEMYDNEAYYPVGIVLMNFVGSSNTSKDLSLVQRILEMNNMYRKAYDPQRSPVDGAFIGGSTGGNRVQSAAPGYSSGMKDNQTDAIGWTRCR